MNSDLMRQVTDPANRHDPYPLYAKLRENRVNLLDDGSYALGRYEDVVALLHDPRISSDPHNAADPAAHAGRLDCRAVHPAGPAGSRPAAAMHAYFGPPSSRPW